MDASCGFTRPPVGARSVSGKDVLGHLIISNQSEEVTMRGGVQSPKITALAHLWGRLYQRRPS